MWKLSVSSDSAGLEPRVCDYYKSSGFSLPLQHNLICVFNSVVCFPNHVSIWLGYSAQLFTQMLIEVLLWKYFVDVIKVYDQLTFF